MSNIQTMPLTNNHNINTHTQPHTHKRIRAKTPSFSSILLDAIYRSIDDDSSPSSSTTTTSTTAITTTSTTSNYNTHTHNKEASNPKQSIRRSKMRSDNSTLLETLDLRRAIMIDSWIDKQPPQDNTSFDEKIRIVRQKSVPSNNRSSTPSDHNHTSSSCFTPSFKLRSNLADSSCLHHHHAPKRASSSRIFTKTKSRALKIYSELKKTKQQQQNNQQPLSPGGRIAAFLNSIFRHSGDRTSPETKVNVISPAAPSMSNSTCSSASSFSRSCLSKTPSSRGAKSSTTTSSNGTKRSVRFYPISVILDEDSKPCGHKSLHNHKINDDFKRKDDKFIVNANVNLDDDYCGQNERKWRREKEIDALMTMIKRNRHECTVSRLDCGDGDDSDDDDDEERESCSSSDLFELENLSSIGISRYSEELPVYGTTRLENLRA